MLQLCSETKRSETRPITLRDLRPQAHRIGDIASTSPDGVKKGGWPTGRLMSLISLTCPNSSTYASRSEISEVFFPFLYLSFNLPSCREGNLTYCTCTELDVVYVSKVHARCGYTHMVPTRGRSRP